MTPSRLESRIATLRAQVRRLLALHGLSRVVGLVVPIVIVLGLADWAIHLDSAVRLAALMGLAGFGAWLVARYVIVPLIVRFGDLDIALRIEQRWPGLNDRLTSTVQFLRIAATEERYGSATLREATIRQTIEETKAIDFREVIERRPVLRALGAALAAVGVGLLFVVAAPDLSAIAVRRLFLPYGPDRWPQQTHLALIDRETPRKVARGEPFTLAVRVGRHERVPGSAHVTYRFEDGETVVEPLRAVEGGIFRGRIESVNRPFRFSVAAGDDTTSIRNVAVQVVPPPTLKDVTARLVAPSYTRLAPQVLALGRTQVRALEGTRLEVVAQANKPIGRAVLHLGEAAADVPVTFDPARTRLATHLTVQDSAPFWFELHDTEGFRNREATRYELRAIRDEPPRVVVEEPANDRDVPAQATVPVAFVVDDDYGIHSARLLYTIAAASSEPTGETAIPLWDAQGQPAEAPPILHQPVRYAWDLAPLKLAPGSILTFHAEARDFDDLKGPNVGKSRELRLRIVSDEEVARQLDDQRREIREETARILAMQKQALVPVEDALRKLARTDALNRTERDELKNAGMIQRQVGNRVTSRTDGLAQKIQRFLDDLRNFKVPNADAQRQMEQMSAGVERIRRDHLGPAEQGLTHATKGLDEGQVAGPTPQPPAPTTEGAKPPQDANSPPEDRGPSDRDRARGDRARAEQAQEAPREGEPSPEAGRPEPAERPASGRRPLENAKSALAEAKTNQKAIADELQKMLDGLSEFETYRGVVKDAQDLLKQHEQEMKQASEAASKPDLIGKKPEELSPEQKGDLANLAARQAGVAKGLQDLQEKMDAMAQRLDESDPLAASAMRGAAEQSRKQGTSAKMSEASDRLEKNQMGEARTAQEQARRELKDLVDSIQNRRERELARLVKELKNAEAELAKLRERQTQNLKKTQEARKNPNAKERADQLRRLAKEQQQIQDELRRQLKRLQKLNAEAAARAGERAAGRMAKAQGELDQDQGEQAGQDEEEALADLEEAEERTRQARRDAEEQLAMEQLAKMGDQLKSVAERQANVVTRIGEYETLRTEKQQDRLTIAQRTGIRGLGQVEAGLKDETDELVKKLEGAPVFALILKRAGEDMSTAAERLQGLKTDEDTLRAARAAANRFQQLIDSLKPDRPKQGKPKDNGGEGGGGPGGGSGDGIPAIAQVKLLKALQEEINERTEYYDQLRSRRKTFTPEQTAELERLQTDQGTLADLARDLTRPRMDDGED